MMDESHSASNMGDLQTEHSEPKAVAEVKDEQGTSGLSSEPIEEDGVEENKKRHLNVVIIGHFEAGKLTIGCQILCLSGQADEQTIIKYVKEAKDKSRESWAHFETESTRFTILHAPVHKSYVPNTISGASLADIGVLVISAREGEFETGCESCEETREHVQLAKTWGVSKLLVVVNKMDDPTVNWSKERYDEIESRMVPFLKLSGFGLADIKFLPISGLFGVNMQTRMDIELCPWWSGQCLFEALDAIEVPPRDPTAPFRMPIIDKSKDMGTVVVMGKVESGSVREGNNMLLMPNKVRVKVVSIYCDEDKVRIAGPGENLRVRLFGYEEEEDMLSGFVLCSIENPIPTVNEFVAQLLILKLPNNAIFTAGFKAVLHIHSVVEECEIIELVHQIDLFTRKPTKKKVPCVKNGAFVICRIQVCNMMCIEKYSDFQKLGRFTLCREGKIVATGKVIDLRA